MLLPRMADTGQAGRRRARAEGARDQQRRRDAADGAALERSGLPAQRGRNRPRHGGLRRPAMKLSTLAALTLTSLAGLMVGICGSSPSEADAKPVSYKLPNDTATFKPGPTLEFAQNNCPACHSVHSVH